MSSSEEELNKKKKKRQRSSSSSCSMTPDAVCRLCQSDKIPGFDGEHGQLLECPVTKLRAHYFCLLFSSGLGQSGHESEGLHGFMPVDIRKEMKRGARLKCVYCKKKGATVGCARQQCKKSYHLPCGMQNQSLQQFYDQFKSYCSTHRPLQKAKQSGEKTTCSICQDEVVGKPCPKSLWTPCCDAWFHRKCLQSMALTSGQYHFRCPLCNNAQKFSQEMQQFGIYLPQRDAAWFDNNEEHQQQPVRCKAKVCFCDKPEGRAYNVADGVWEVLPCYSCGSGGIHVRCGGMDEYVDPEWHCYTCRRIVKDPEDEEAKRNSNRPIREIWGTAQAKKTKSEVQQCMVEKLPQTITNNSNTVTITPITSQTKTENSFGNNHPGASGVEIRMVVPIKAKLEDPPPPPPSGIPQETMRLTLEDIIVNGLNSKSRETNYKCTKAFSDKFNVGQKVPQKPVEKRHNSVDTEQGSPGDSDYESAHEGLPFKIRKKANTPNVPVQKKVTQPTEVVDQRIQKIQKSIKDFFHTGEAK